MTAKFSEKFYQRLGHELVDELIDWCNQVDATYRSDFRELIDTRFARMEAEVKQGLGVSRVDTSGEIATLRTDVSREIASLRADVSGEIATLRTELARAESRLTLRMFLFWVGSVGMFVLQRL